MRRSALVLYALACSGSPRAPTGPAPAPLPDAGAPGVADAAPPDAPPRGPAGLGRACTPDPERLQGDCQDGLLCFPAPGGICVASCDEGATCPAGGVCTDSVRGGRWCLAPCASDAQCRADEGYACDPAWQACVPPGVRTPRPPLCPATAAPAPPRTTFGPATQISTPAGPGVSHLEPAAALDAEGNLTAVFIARTGFLQANPLGVSTVLAGGGVDGDRALASDRENHFDPWIAADRKGRLHLVWLGFDGARVPERRMQIGYATSADGNEWTAVVGVHDAADCPDDEPGCLDKPMIAVGPDPRRPKREVVYVFYYSAPRDGMRLVRSTDGGESFRESVAVGAGAYGDAEVDPKGVVHVVYVAGADPRATGFGDPAAAVEYVRSTDGGKSFSAPVTVSSPGPGETIPFYFSNPQIVSDPARKLLYVVYPQGSPDGAWDIVLAVSRDGGASWARLQVNDDPHCANHMTPAATLDPKSGRVFIAWLENRRGTGAVAFAACDAGALACAANELISDTPFAAYDFSRHTTTWLGEYFTLLFDPKSRHLHAVWTQPVAEQKRVIGRIFHAKSAQALPP